MKTLEIAVAGCGPAGLATALLLSRDGHRVTLFERFTTPRPIGSGLMIQPTGLAVLHMLGLAEIVLAKGARIDRLIGKTDRGRKVLDVRYADLGRGGHFGIGIHRAALFDALTHAVTEASIMIETSREVVRSKLLSGGRRNLEFADGASAGPFDLVVDALGTGTPLAPPTGHALAYGALWASLDWPRDARFDVAALEQRYVRASKMAGVMPIGQPDGFDAPQAAFFWSLRADQFDAWRRGGLDAWKTEVLALWPVASSLLDQVLTAERLTFARYNHRTLACPSEPAMIHIGDAWHSTSPQLGQGANMALLDVYALAMALRSAPDVAGALSNVVAARRTHVAVYQGMSRLFTPIYQSDGVMLPWMRDWLVGPVARLWPAPAVLALIVSGLVGAPLRRLGLETVDIQRAAKSFVPEPRV